MKRPNRPGFGFTLVEVLVATVLTLMLMAAVTTMFGRMGQGIEASRSVLESADRQRAAALRLQRDLEGLTVTMSPPRRPEANEGYFELIEGPIGPDAPPWQVAVKPDPSNPANYVPDTTVGDFDDVLMFTTRSVTGRPFVGRLAGGVLQSDVAEVAWFVRGRTLYRRQLLVAASAPVAGFSPQGFYAYNDLSVRRLGNNTLVANTLGDLTRRECRFAHDVRNGLLPLPVVAGGSFPFDVRGWGQLGLPTLRECSSSQWIAGDTSALNQVPQPSNQFDLWTNSLALPQRPHPWQGVDPETGTMLAYQDGQRLTEDVILTNVIGFDVKVWDSGAGQYVDLGYARMPYQAYAQGTTTAFGHLGHPASRLVAGQRQARVYDTWSLHYEYDGYDQSLSTNGSGPVDEGFNGFDDDGNGVIDDPDERETAPPYPSPLRGIQVRIRAFEPSSRQVRELTVVQDFLPR